MERREIKPNETRKVITKNGTKKWIIKKKWSTSIEGSQLSGDREERNLYKKKDNSNISI